MLVTAQRSPRRRPGQPLRGAGVRLRRRRVGPGDPGDGRGLPRPGVPDVPGARRGGQRLGLLLRAGARPWPTITRFPSCSTSTTPTELDTIRKAVDLGFTSVMIDGSSLPFEENVRLTRAAVEIAHPHGVSVEARTGPRGRHGPGGDRACGKRADRARTKWPGSSRRPASMRWPSRSARRTACTGRCRR